MFGDVGSWYSHLMLSHGGFNSLLEDLHPGGVWGLEVKATLCGYFCLPRKQTPARLPPHNIAIPPFLPSPKFVLPIPHSQEKKGQESLQCTEMANMYVHKHTLHSFWPSYYSRLVFGVTGSH